MHLYQAQTRLSLGSSPVIYHSLHRMSKINLMRLAAYDVKWAVMNLEYQHLRKYKKLTCTLLLSPD